MDPPVWPRLRRAAVAPQSGIARHRLRATLRRFVVFAFATVVAASVVLATAPPTQAQVFNIVPAHGNLDTDTEFEAGEPIFAYVTTGRDGGEVCLRGYIGDLYCTGAPPFFADFLPVVRPGLIHAGTYTLTGTGGAESAEFHVSPCATACPVSLGDDFIDLWKGRARTMAIATGISCLAFTAWDKAENVRSFSRLGDFLEDTIEDKSEIVGDVVESGITILGVTAFPGGLAFPETSPLDQFQEHARKIAKELSCASAKAYRSILADPPQHSSDLAQPVRRIVPRNFDPVYQAWSEALNDLGAYNRASLTTYERYLGAVLDDDLANARAQLAHLAELSHVIAGLMRRLGPELEGWADDLLSQPGGDATVSAVEYDLLVATHTRIRSGGFNADEIAAFHAAGLNDNEIAEIRQEEFLDLPTPITDIPVDVPVRETVGSLADLMIQNADFWDAFADHAALIAANIASQLNAPPVAQDASATWRESKPYSVVLAASDAEGQTLTYSIVDPPEHGTLTDCATGSAPTPRTPDSSGSMCSRGRPSTERPISNVASFQVTITANQVPVATDESAETKQDLGFAAALEALDGDSDALELTIVSPPAHGTLAACPTGFLCGTYTPDPGYAGPDSFTWKVNDGLAESNVATYSVVMFPIAVSAVTRDDDGAEALAGAMIRDPATLTGASFVTVPTGTPGGTPHGVSTALGPFPTHGQTFGVLTSGDALLADDPNSSPSSSSILLGPNVRGDTDRDVSILRLDLVAPAGTNCVRFDFAYYSEEYPEFVDTQFNDAFVAELNTTTWATNGSSITAPDNFAFDTLGNEISINSSGVTAMSPGSAAGTTYDGATRLLRASTVVSPGSHHLYLSIFDQGDPTLDSAVFVDDIRFESVADPAINCAKGAQSPDDSPDNTAPTVDAGPDGIGSIGGSAIVLDGTVTDPNAGDTLTTLWSYVAGPGVVSGAMRAFGDPSAVDTSVACSDIGEYTVTLRADDGVNPAVQDSAKVTITSPDQAPTLDSIPDVGVDEGETVAFSASGHDPDGDALAYSLTGCPNGSTIDPFTGAFSWATAEEMGPASLTCSVVVTADTVEATRSFTITVREINRYPTLYTITDRTAHPGEAVSLTAAGHDADLPAQTLIYSLGSAPATATINPVTGAFAWTPTLADVGDASVTIGVDDGHGGSASSSFTIHVVSRRHDAHPGRGHRRPIQRHGDAHGDAESRHHAAGRSLGHDHPRHGIDRCDHRCVRHRQRHVQPSRPAAGALATGSEFLGTLTDAPATATAGVFLVTREDLSLEFTGVTSATMSTAVNLSAQAMDLRPRATAGLNSETLDRTLGDVTRGNVAFALYPLASCATGTPIATLVAAVTTALRPATELAERVRPGPARRSAPSVSSPRWSVARPVRSTTSTRRR